MLLIYSIFYFYKLYPLIELIITKPLLLNSQFQNVKKTTLDLLKKENENPYNIAFEKWRKLVYFEHHYDDMIIKDYKFGQIHDLLNSYGFKMIKKSKMMFRKSFEYIYINKKISNFCGYITYIIDFFF